MSAVPQPTHRYTVADLDRPEFDGMKLELWEGELVEMSPAPKPSHNLIARRVQRIFEDFCSARHGLEAVSGNDGVPAGPDPTDSYLIPDAGLYREAGMIVDDAYSRTPELVVEVESPCNTVQEFTRKRSLYFAGGAEQVWIVSPRQKSIEVWFRDRHAKYFDHGVFEGEGVVEGLRIELDELFAPRARK